MVAANVPPGEKTSIRKVLRGLKWRVWVAEKIRPSDLQLTLFWAGVIGFFGALVSLLFRYLTEEVHWLFTQQTGEYAQTFANLPPWRRLATPAFGGLVAGAIIYLGMRLRRSKYTTDYMEAIVVGEGVISARSSLIKTFSAMFSIASGASIGREGPLVQLSSLCASLFGRWQNWSLPRRRLLVACGAAAGIASAYNAPIAGALFVAEIVLGTTAMEIFGPLVFASVIATLTTQRFIGTNPLYSASFELKNDWEILTYLALGLLAGVFASWFLRLLRASERLFAQIPLPVYARIALGGLVVGALAVLRPEVAGNGYGAIENVLQSHWLWSSLALILVSKLIATAASFGSGAVGGVFTPTLTLGACGGFLFGAGMQQLFGPHAVSNPSAFALVGMGAFLAATTHAPLMAILMLFELTLDYHLILPLMLGCVVAYYVSINIERRSIYSEAMQRKGASYFDQRLADVRVADLVKPNPLAVLETAQFREIGNDFLAQRFNYLYVIDPEQTFRGAISLHDIKAYLHQPELADLVIARDIMRDDFRTIARNVSVHDALQHFGQHDGERLPVVADERSRKLVGSLSKTDLILALSQRESDPAAAEK